MEKIRPIRFGIPKKRIRATMQVLFVVTLLVAFYVWMDPLKRKDMDKMGYHRENTRWRNVTRKDDDIKNSGDETIIVPHLSNLNNLKPSAVNQTFKNAVNSSEEKVKRVVVRGDDWQVVGVLEGVFYVYSAYLDDRVNDRFVRVIGAGKTKGSQRVLCKFIYSNSTPIVVNATNKVITNHINLKYSATFILCPLSTSIKVPDEVSIVSKPTDVPLNRLKVLNHDSKDCRTVVEESFAICVKPMHSNYSETLRLIEFFELNRILGVQHFVFYTHTMTDDVNCTLAQYEKEILVTILPWQKLNLISKKQTDGIMAAINDCLYRTMYKYKYVLIIDIDEFIVPHQHMTLKELLNTMGEQNVGSFAFRNSFFHLKWPSDIIAEKLYFPPLKTLQKTRRTKSFYPHRLRSKSIVRPERVVEMGNHLVWEFLPGFSEVDVNLELGFLHHYRDCKSIDHCVDSETIVDQTTFKYKKDLIEAVYKRVMYLKQQCGLEVEGFS